MENKLPKRKPLRLKLYDYSTPGSYFITICTFNRKCSLSKIVGAIHESPETKLTEYGEIVERWIKKPPQHLPILIERYVIMPNHVHLIIRVSDGDEWRAIRESPLRGRSVISKTIGYIKTNVSKEIHQLYGDATVWQRGFHDHVIRDLKDYEKISNYIFDNPRKWQQDCLYLEEE